MNSIVCISQVPDTETRIKVGSDSRSIDESGIKFIVSPYDEFALEEAIRLKEARGGDVTVVSFGPDRVQQALRECLARGATKAIHVKGDTRDVDSLGIARVLAAAIRTTEFDMVFVGKQGVGTDNSLVGPMLAELLDIPHLNVVTHIEIAEDGKITAHREIEGAEVILETKAPALVAAQKGMNEPRYSSLKGIMAAKKIAIDVKSVADLGLSEGELNGGVKWTKIELPAEKAAGRKIDGKDAKEAAQEILRFIREEAKAL